MLRLNPLQKNEHTMIAPLNEKKSTPAPSKGATTTIKAKAPASQEDDSTKEDKDNSAPCKDREDKDDGYNFWE